ncbi:undecaprenyl-diphosphate phosphatase [Candidatus Avelusimicrobium alvi]|uniref:undecaprenyl-diphosphate phosphatase n=1 Tax=Candidatus Avelusimicrobium alvi TaxID=3416221 RepID=UPI003D131D5B
MTVFDAVLLGLLQALGEFLPISSSAHLVLLPYFRGMEYQGLAFDVILHAATLLAVLLYFAKDWFVLVKEGLTNPSSKDGRMLWYLAAATVPAGLAGLLFKDWAEHAFRNPLMMAACLMVFACVLWWADRKGGHNDGRQITFKTLMLIGCAQALAIMPGVSRSGITITAALLLGLSRSASARISFLLSAPIIAGAAAVEIGHLSAADFTAPLIWGFVSAFLGALVVIGCLMKYIKTHSFDVFVYYRLALGLVIIGFYFWK